MKEPTIQEEQWISKKNSYSLRAKESLTDVLSACYLNLYLNKHGLYDKNFTTMTDEDYVEYTALLERLHRLKVK
jgi:hypothetical protein